jgi:acyl transferase domain-containing protein/NADP-dependent 3-hydroxy acid dehydrogenase YdfG/acyl carrier protein
VAGVIKVVLAMTHGRIPATLHIDRPSTHVDWDAGAVRLATEAQDWPERGHPRRAGVSGFGISGTNAHVVLEHVPGEDPDSDAETPVPAPLDGPVPLLVSGRTAAGRAARAATLADLLESGARPVEVEDLPVLATALRHGRSTFDHRAVVLAADHDAAVAGLRALAAGADGPDLVVGSASPGRTAVLFSGQGAQRAGMGRELYAAYDVFAEAFDAACAHLDPHLDRPLRDVVFAEPGSEDAALLDRTGWTQPALFAVELALFRLLESWGLRPEVLLGHSIGEITAAHVAGVLDLAGAARLVAARASLMEALPSGGAMAAVALGEDAVTALIEGRPDLGPDIGIAAVNGPISVVVSGAEDAVDAVVAAAKAGGHRVTRLAVSHAFHSPLMEPMLADFAAAIADIEFAAPRRTLVSALTGRVATAEELTDPATWVRHVRAEVRFADAVVAAAEQGATRFVEIGPDAALTPLVGQCLEALEVEPDLVVAARRRDTDERVGLLRAVAALHAAGDEIDPVAALDTGAGADAWARSVPAALLAALPTYPFARRRYWPRPPRLVGDVRSLGLDAADHPMLGAAVELPDGGHLVTGRLTLRAHPWIADHALLTGAGDGATNGDAVVILPGTGFLELAMAAGIHVAGPDTTVAEMTIAAPIVLTRDNAVDLRIHVGAPAADGARPLEIRGRLEGDPEARWTPHASGFLVPAPTAAPITDTGAADLAGAWPPPGAEETDIGDFYARFAEQGFVYGPAFTGLRRVWLRPREEVDGQPVGPEVFAEIALPDPVADTAAEMGVHPALLDGALQTMMFAGLGETETGRLPFAWTGVRLHASGARRLRSRLVATGPESVSLTVADPTGALVLTSEQLALRSVGSVSSVAASVPVDPAVRAARAAVLRWAWREQTPAGTGDGTPTVLRVLADPASDAEGTTRAVADLLGPLRDWLAEDDGTGPALVVTTVGAVGPEAEPTAAAVAGLVRSAQVENPGRIVLVDTDGPELPDALAASLAADPGEPQWTWRAGAGAGETRVARLVPAAVEEPGGPLVPPPLPAGRTGAWRLERGADGSPDALVLVPVPVAADEPGPGEVRLAVRAAGLYPSDLRAAPAESSDAVAPLGRTVAGVVLAVGEGAEEFAVGDRVSGAVAGAAGPLARAEARALVVMPEGGDFAASAAAALSELAGTPVTWDIRRARDAALALSGMGDTGPVVLTVAPALDPAGTVLVTGGTGGLGAELARHLVVGLGVRSLVLSSRRGPDAPGAAELVEELTSAGARVQVLAADVTNRAAVDALVAAAPSDAPLTAVVHTAGVLADGVLTSQDADGIARVLGPKLDGARHLADAVVAAGAELAAFVLYSSIAGTLGSAGQANYAAANAALDALAVRLRAGGLPAQSLAWGPWVPTGGMTATLSGTERARLAAGALPPFAVAEGMAAFDVALQLDEAVLVPTRLNPETAPNSVAPALREVLAARAPRRTTAAAGTSEGFGGTTAEPGELVVAHLAAMQPGERPDALLGMVIDQVASVLGHGSADDIDPDQAFSEIGFDSLTSVELRNRLGSAAGVRLPATLVFDYPTPAVLAELLGERLAERVEAATRAVVGTGAAGPGADAPATGGGGAAAAAVERLEQLAGEWGDADRSSAARRLRELLTRLENGSTNGHSNGRANGHSNGSANGHSNGSTTGSATGHGSGNDRTNGGTNGAGSALGDDVEWPGAGATELDPDLAEATSADDIFALIDEELDA